MKTAEEIANEIYFNWQNNESTRNYEACLIAAFAAAIENERKELTDLVATLTSERDEAIEKLKQRDERVIEVLEPFAKYAVELDDDWQQSHVLLGERWANGPKVCAGDLRQASALLAELRKEKK